MFKYIVLDSEQINSKALILHEKLYEIYEIMMIKILSLSVRTVGE
jgi:hypothetical protein